MFRILVPEGWEWRFNAASRQWTIGRFVWVNLYCQWLFEPVWYIASSAIERLDADAFLIEVREVLERITK